jgi:hypothetical protein
MSIMPNARTWRMLSVQLQVCLEVEYMTQRIHATLGYLTLSECEAADIRPAGAFAQKVTV